MGEPLDAYIHSYYTQTIRWDAGKNEWLKRTRGKSFEDILNARLVAVEQNSRKPHQSLMLFELEGYIWVMPCVVNDEEIFLKTLYPCRAYTKRWRRGELI